MDWGSFFRGSRTANAVSFDVRHQPRGSPLCLRPGGNSREHSTLPRDIAANRRADGCRLRCAGQLQLRWQLLLDESSTAGYATTTPLSVHHGIRIVTATDRHPGSNSVGSDAYHPA